MRKIKKNIYGVAVFGLMIFAVGVTASATFSDILIFSGKIIYLEMNFLIKFNISTTADIYVHTDAKIKESSG